MRVEQISAIINSITSQYEGITPIENNDLSNVVTLGEEIQNAMGFDNFVRSLADHIGRVIFVDRVYQGRAPSVLMDGWEYGSILEKIAVKKLPIAEDNESWELRDGASYDPNIFKKPEVDAKFWNQRITFEVQISIAEKQVKSAFDSARQLNAFMSMLYTSVENSMTVKFDGLIMSTISNFIGETIANEYATAAYSAGSGTRAVNLLYLYNQLNGTTLTAEKCVTTPEFIRFASLTMANYIDQLKVMSGKFNVGGADRFTPASDLHVVMLSEFMNAANAYLQSDVFHDRYTALPLADTVAFWQGSGTENTFADHSKITITTSSGKTINISGVIACMFDRNALGVTNYERRVTSHWNARAEFWNQWHKFDAGYFNDLNENGVVFFVA